MGKLDIYTDEKLSLEHSLRFLHITTGNVIGVLNRIASLMRRKRYNMEEVSVAFDIENNAHMIIAIDGRLIDVHHAIKQLKKLYDVMEVEDVTHKYERIYNVVHVEVDDEDEFTAFPFYPERIVHQENSMRGVFILSLEETTQFIPFLIDGKFNYSRQILGLV
jgi:acetolactate synthase small subunit